MKPHIRHCTWNSLADNTRARHARVALTGIAAGKVVPEHSAGELLAAILEPGDRVCIEGNNQKQARALARALAGLDPATIHDLHMLQSCVQLSEHLAVFERGIARRLDVSYAGPQAGHLAALVADGRVELGSFHTYAELYSRYFLDLAPRVALVAAQSADRAGNLYTGPNTEETPLIVEAAKCRQGIVVAQVETLVERVPRVDIAADWVDYVIVVGEPCLRLPLFTRDPAKISDASILIAMMVLKGIYLPLGITSLNHGIGHDTAAIELLLPTYGAELGMRGTHCTHWALNPHPTLIPAIESGFVKSVYSFGAEEGMDAYVAERSDVFALGPDGSLRSNRPYAQMAGQYAVDLFVGATLEIDQYGNSTTITPDRFVGFGGAPHMGSNPRGRRHATHAWQACAQGAWYQQQGLPGRKAVVQIAHTVSRSGRQAFVERLSAVGMVGMPACPVMIYGDDVTHVVSENGIAHLWRCRDREERRRCICAIAGEGSTLRPQVSDADSKQLRASGLVSRPGDIGVEPARATGELLAARSLDDIVEWSGGLYSIPVCLA
ncbi:MAG: malonate decarboxylase subunit alpha [Deltaproteobacteria bacterium]|nr:malonate decarboxylase subunit alpha [Deltaproteobacteria bacterium]